MRVPPIALASGLLTAALAAGCAARDVPLQPPVERLDSAASSSGRIEHVVILIQENRSFDNLFATFPGADGATTGKTHGGTVPLVKRNLADPYDLQHGYEEYRTEYDRGAMDGFDSDVAYGTAPALWAYQYVAPSQVSTYWTLAKQYVLADRAFMTEGSSSFVAHQDLIAGGTRISKAYSIVDSPTSSPWGCDAPPGTVTSLITFDNEVLDQRGPFPCFTYPTLADLLDRQHISWRYYAASPQFGWQAFEAIKAIRYGSHWQTNVSSPSPNLLGDIARHRLAAVSWVTPDVAYSDHPGEAHDYGPSWIGDVVNAIGESSYWKSTAIVVVWDDWGGFYDHVPPPQVGFGGLGFRVPMLIVSAYARSGHVSHSPYEFGSILRFIEDTWGLGRLGSSDVRAKSIVNAFDFTSPPRRYVPVHTDLPPEFFLALPPSNRPIDSD
jgi:phospholipase C